MLEGVAREVHADITQFFSRERLERAAMQEERVRLAHELHDGILQCLTGVTLQLEALSRLIVDDPDLAKERLRVIGDLIEQEQRELRVWIRRLGSPGGPAVPLSVDLAASLESLCRRVETQWGLRVEFRPGTTKLVPPVLGDEVYRLIQEALANAARHAQAKVVRVDLEASRDRVHIVVADDGKGFPYHGRYILEALLETRLGPISLKHRIASLGGNLVLTSGAGGSRLEMSLPFAAQKISAASRTSSARKKDVWS
jgi:signal transduction histidine kinase